MKRVLDLGLLAILALPTLLVTGASCLLVKLFSKGPALYRQTRVGFEGRLFEVWKIRTMKTDAESILARHLESDQSAREEWNQYFKLKNDPRVIPYVGAFLRRSSIDEFPQLLNVLTGEMSFVGPRPLPVYHFENLEAEFQKVRQFVPPGLTGLWQINERADGGLDSHRFWDTRYIRNFSLAADIEIVLRTPMVLIKGRGAY